MLNDNCILSRSECYRPNENATHIKPLLKIDYMSLVLARELLAKPKLLSQI